jgi:hypothetical protein
MPIKMPRKLASAVAACPTLVDGNPNAPVNTRPVAPRDIPAAYFTEEEQDLMNSSPCGQNWQIGGRLVGVGRDTCHGRFPAATWFADGGAVTYRLEMLAPGKVRVYQARNKVEGVRPSFVCVSCVDGYPLVEALMTVANCVGFDLGQFLARNGVDVQKGI